jgi:hypothetical protein
MIDIILIIAAVLFWGALGLMYCSGLDAAALHAKRSVIKSFAILLSIFPGILFALALFSYVCCSYAQRNLSKAGADIGLGILMLAALINIPTAIAWFMYFIFQISERNKQS